MAFAEAVQARGGHGGAGCGGGGVGAVALGVASGQDL